MQRRLHHSENMMESTSLEFSPARNPAAIAGTEAATAAAVDPFIGPNLHQTMIEWKAWAQGPFTTIIDSADEHARATISEGVCCNSCIFFLRQMCVTKKSSSRVNFFCGKACKPVTRIYRKKKLHDLPQKKNYTT